ncbi:hypothetical protein Y1Q_0001801 [Alligator mississippiensis]|uniref:DDE Tnp4 domain-containing protein n=1 Tax=Alligator mississippiensis TaxID=8496 RepID=A0A151MKY0_ALLMI|nr:hypothetical protein Y1Q_0001801 [Alligator mississippiensis]
MPQLMVPIPASAPRTPDTTRDPHFMQKSLVQFLDNFLWTSQKDYTEANVKLEKYKLDYTTVEFLEFHQGQKGHLYQDKEANKHYVKHYHSEAPMFRMGDKDVLWVQDPLEVMVEFCTLGFSQCIRALDRTHIPISCPPHGHRPYYSWQGFHFIMFQAIIDHCSAFTNMSASTHDAHIFCNPALPTLVESGQLCQECQTSNWVQ